MASNCFKKETANKILTIVSIVILPLIFFIQQGNTQIPLYYPYPPAFFNPIYSFGYFPAIASQIYQYPVRNAFALLSSSGGGTTSLLTTLLTPTTPISTAQPLIGVATAITLAAGGGISNNTLVLLSTTPVPVPTFPTLTTPTIGTTTALLLGGGGVSTSTLLLLGI